MNIPLVDTVCDLCGSAAYSSVFEKDGLSGVRCSSCGLIYINPRPADEYLKNEVYNEGYFDAEKGYGIEDVFGKSRLESLKRADELFAEIEMYGIKGSVLDAGCAAGYFLETARKRGWEPHGIEISDFAARHARENLNLEVLTGDLVRVELPNEKYDLALLMDTIEHLTSPKKGLERIYSALKPGGMLVVETPNYESTPARFLGAEWGLVAPEHHLFYFTPSTLKRLAAETGFHVVSMTFPRWGLTDLLFSAGSLRKAGFPVGDREKQFVRNKLRVPRDAVRATSNIIDRLFFTPLLKKTNGVTIRMIAKKNP